MEPDKNIINDNDGHSGTEKKIDLRAELRELGYLHNPVETFLAGPLHKKTSVLRSTINLSIKLGLVLGVFLTAIFFTGTVIINPQLMQAPRDFFLFLFHISLIYIGGGIIFCLLGGLLITAVSMKTGVLIPKARLFSLGFGLAGAALAFIYGVLWWDYFGHPWLQNILADILALITILIISAILGRWLIVSTYILLSIIGKGEGPAPAPQTRKRTFLEIGFVLAGILFFFIYMAFPRHENPSTEARQFPANINLKPVKYKILLIGIDNLKPDILKSQAKKQGWTAFQQIIEEGSIIPLEMDTDQVIPARWTSIATGVPAREHGIRTFGDRTLVGMSHLFKIQKRHVGIYEVFNAVLPKLGLTREVPISNFGLQRRTIWEILSRYGGYSGIFNWWATWPAEKINGVLYSDRAYPMNLLKRQSKNKDLFKETDTAWNPRVPLESIPDFSPEYIVKHSAEFGLETSDKDERYSEAELKGFSLALGVDKYYCYTSAEELKLAVNEGGSFNLFSIYLPGYDILNHHLLTSGKEPDTYQLQRILDLNYRYLDILDQEIEKLKMLMGPDTIVCLISDPGLNSGPEDKGYMFITGEMFKAQEYEKSIKPEQVTPLLLYLLGYPVPRNMGDLPEPLIAGEFLKAHPPEFIESYGLKEKNKVNAKRSTLDQLLQEQLSSFGYLQD